MRSMRRLLFGFCCPENRPWPLCRCPCPLCPNHSPRVLSACSPPERQQTRGLASWAQRCATWFPLRNSPRRPPVVEPHFLSSVVEPGAAYDSIGSEPNPHPETGPIRAWGVYGEGNQAPRLHIRLCRLATSLSSPSKGKGWGWGPTGISGDNRAWRTSVNGLVCIRPLVSSQDGLKAGRGTRASHLCSRKLWPATQA